jgi:NADH-quinone oxidoreductase subunit J
MDMIFYLSAVIAVMATLMVVTRLHAVHALLYFIVSLLSVALIFFVLGAPFAAALEIIIYAGAIMVLFVFVVMMLNLGSQAIKQEQQWLNPRIWTGPGILSAVLLGELIYLFTHHASVLTGMHMVSPKQVGISLFGPYVLGVELASFLLLSGLIGAFHLGRRSRKENAHKGEKSP